MNGWDDQVLAVGAIAVFEGLMLLVLLIWVAAVASRVRKLKKAHAKMIGDTGVNGLEDVLHHVHEHLISLDRKQQVQEATLSQQERRLTAMKGRVGVHRFNAFAETGSDLSFSVAIVNDEQDGVVITGIYGREQTFLYAKPLDKGQSSYTLTPEEKIAISQALPKE
ncbi:DUF4446 family protein [Cohnella pontilimi]|uniref:DUF4446 family protein n=1 Tax=Cohnella pontilimi TaxID=2564100 RepID=A0A4U0FAN2_9BACL|nr:DUF4446 family protein [Cohnella pontilimi]TJY41711.1 DUF4446 family protein [Cohnella pontilimi]